MTRFKGRMHRGIRRGGDGETITLRRSSNLRNATTSKAATALELVGSVLAGATSANVTAETLNGSLPAGYEITIGGETVTIIANTQAIQAVLPVEFDPPLVAGYSAGEPVVVGSQLDFTFTQFAPDQVYEKGEAGTRRSDRELWIYSDTGAVPLVGDLLVETGEKVQDVEKVRPGSMTLAFAIYVGGR